MTEDIKLLSRRAGCKLHILDRAGNAAVNTKIRLQQTNHEFLFGCGGFETIAYTSMLDGDEKKIIKDRIDKWLEIFNFATLPFYWGGFEPVEGKPETESRMKAAEFLIKNNVKVKGHPLCWHTVCADWLMQYDNDTILKKQLNRINRDVTGFKGTIDMWDVINEVVIMPIFDKYDNAVTRICKARGRVGLIKDVFKAAKEANPDAVLLINDFNLSTAYEILIDGCLEAGVPISAIGIQSHQHQGYWGLEKLEEILERYEHFGLPIHFTENTLVSGTLIPPEIEDLNDWKVDSWPSTPELEERQKNQMEEIYRTLFKHPLVKAVTNWNFSDDAWLHAPAGIIRTDNSLKPSYNMLKQLIKKEWWTDTEYETDSDGNVYVEGFKGEYIVSAGKESANILLNSELTNKEAEIRLS